MPGAHAVVLVLATIVAGIGVGGALSHTDSRTVGSEVAAPTTTTVSTTVPRPTVVPLAAITSASAGVVDVNATLGYQSARSSGSGMALTSDGEILTNNHVIEGATSISVTDTANGQTYPATVVGYGVASDVAVIQLQGAAGLATVSVGTSPAQVGDPVVAVGNAGGAGGRPASARGRVTALGQSISAADALSGASEQLEGLIETNAAVVAGYSGGPLIDAYGRVVGMDTAASTGYVLGADATQGYAIPIARARQVEDQILAGRSSSEVHVGPTAFLGVVVASYGDSVAGGASDVVVTVAPRSPADQAGVFPGATITAVDGALTASPAALAADLLADRPGQQVSLAWRDAGGGDHTALVTLGSGPPQ
ncbi:S1C family serine protease [Acidiferrimicrobium sp. IK]|uniref:S1C family serine protease n=1 Tax=Acidiferrimicrobium sp. IK TaxID=2871700 RepID=UPI0021CAE6D0|nr:S1C family serine protease [Acidiferrimicrobium sp. IK]MCU4187376.1 S1C family serine protease [Acidiferrimicrobium sp. IK]